MLFAAIAAFAAETTLQSLWIWLQLSGKLKIFQKQKSYGPQIDVEKKASTPSMGGIVFFLMALPMCFLSQSPHIWIFAAVCSLVGFIDDALKFLGRSSEGFKSLGKLSSQIFISMVYAVWFSVNFDLNIASYECPVWLEIPLVVFFSVGFQNAVNVTDGLDGLAAGSIALSLAGMCFAGIYFSFDMAVAFGMVLGFLWHNSHPAKVFMGDTGSHFLAGMLFSLILAQGELLLFIPVGFLFGIEIISVAIQIVAIRKFKRKVFKMSPLHHHFQLIGWKETLIVNRFWIVHILGMSSVFVMMKALLI